MTESNDMAKAAEEAGCASFESTLALCDGLLEGDALARASAHAKDCAVCGPMVAGWDEVADALRARFDDAAELAKPDLAGLADRVLAEVAKPAPAPKKTFADRFFGAFRALQAPLALAAAAGAIAFVVYPMVHDPVEPAEEPVAAAPATSPNDLHVHKLAFEDADGTVMTAGDDMTVIWITEHEGA